VPGRPGAWLGTHYCTRSLLMENLAMNVRIAISILLIGSFTLFGWIHARGEIDNPPLPADVLKGTSVTLEEGLRASEIAGKPISARFEVEDGQLQLSVYVVTDTGYAEAIIATDTGILMSAQKMTDPDDLEAARAQNQAVRGATIPLRIATEKVVMNRRGIRGVSVVPETRAGRPGAKVTLLNKGTFTTVWQPLQ
jgi:hypothetical protein